MTNLDARSGSSGTEPHQIPPPSPPDRSAEPTGSSAIRLAMVVGAVVLLGLWAGVSAVVVVLAIVVMIFLHELGHYLTAKWAGMKVTEFFIGFGPRIWSFHRGETEYGLKAIPAGAYVKVIGMTNLEEVDPGEEDRTYRSKPYWRRMSVAVAGSTMHFVVALICLVVFFTTIGMPQDDNWEVGHLAALGEEGAPGPAVGAGIEVGDRIVAVDGTEVVTFTEFRDRVRANDPGDTVTVLVDRGGEQAEVPVTLAAGDDGAAFFGVGPSYPSERLAPHTAVGQSVSEFAEYSQLTVEAIFRIFSPSGLSGFVGQAVDTARTDDSGAAAEPVPIEEQGDRVLSIYGAARLGAQMTDTGPAGLLLFLALINIFIGIFNLVPLLPLDGGHVAIATYEKAREMVSRSGERYYADVGKLIPLTYAVIFVLIGVGLVALYLDIANPLDLPT